MIYNIKKSMTCIAIIKNRSGKLIMAGDRRVSWGFHMAQSMDIPKINKKDNVLLGGTGHGDLCSLFVDNGGFQIPEKRMRCLNTYMYNIFKPAVYKFLLSQKYGDKDKLLSLPPDTYVEIVIGIEKQVWALIIRNPLSEEHPIFAGEISLGPLATPYATGCGGLPALSILKYEQKKQGYITKQNLIDALTIVADIAPGCDDQIDSIQED